MENRRHLSALYRTMVAMAEWVSSGRVRRFLVLVALAAAGVLAGRVAVLLLDVRSPSVPEASSAAARTSDPRDRSPDQPPRASHHGDPTRSRAALRAASALHVWDARRAAAYARGDAAALRRLYLPGSGAGARDVRVLEAYADRGLVVRGLRTQVLALEVRGSGPDRVRLEVTDRTVGARAVGGGVRAVLPRDAPSTRVVVLRALAGEWRVASVRDA